jgi:integrase
MAPKTYQTWGQCLDFTLKTRDRWVHGNGRPTAIINTSHFTRHYGRGLRVDKIDQAFMDLYIHELEKEGKTAGTINRCISAVSTVLNHCHRRKLIAKPDSFERKGEAAPREFFYSIDELGAMIQAANSIFRMPELGDIILFAVYTGMRQGEILRLKTIDVNFPYNLIHVHSSKSEASTRTIPISAQIKPMLEQRVADAVDDRVFWEFDNKDTLLRQLKKVTAYIGLDENYLFHTLRHTFCTLNAQNGVPLHELAEMMGHNNIKTTLRYAKVSAAAKQAHIAAMPVI